MILYHFTSPDHLPLMLRDGLIKATESNVGSPKRSWKPHGEHVGPDVVWLIDTPDLGALSHGLSNAHHDKTAVRITVDIDDAVRWRDWEPHHEMHTKWRAAFSLQAEDSMLPITGG